VEQILEAEREKQGVASRLRPLGRESGLELCGVVAALGGVTAYTNIEAEVAKWLLVAGGWTDEQWVTSMVV